MVAPTKKLGVETPKIDLKKLEQSGQRLIQENLRWLKEMAKK